MTCGDIAPGRVTGPGEELPPAASMADSSGRVARTSRALHAAPADERRLVPSKTAAQVLAISERTLWSLQNRGEIPSVRIGRCIRFDLRDLDRWIEAHKRSKSAGR
jgi:excisionase family DNA binding protein